jgi:hypothetical protein
MMNPDSGLTNSVIPVFMARVLNQTVSTPDDSEAIEEIEAFSIEEIKQGFIDGYLSTKDGERIHLRDPFLAFAILQTDIRTSFKEKK